MAGKLYMIGSPIGNLGDISPRTTGVLSTLDRLYCEDTRVTGKLMAKLGLSVPLRSLSDDSPKRGWLRAIEYITSGHKVGFITDAGMPGLSDPGRELLKLAWEREVSLTVLPGPSSVGALIALCPFSCHQFCFEGFAPRKAGEIASFISQIANSSQPVFFFDSPKRIHKLLDKLCAELAPGREVLVGRELTKLHEQVVLFLASEWLETSLMIPPKGEFTIAVSGKLENTKGGHVEVITDALKRMEKAGFSKRDAAKAVAAALNLSGNEVKKAAFQSEANR